MKWADPICAWHRSHVTNRPTDPAELTYSWWHITTHEEDRIA